MDTSGTLAWDYTQKVVFQVTFFYREQIDSRDFDQWYTVTKKKKNAFVLDIQNQILFQTIHKTVIMFAQ